MQHDRKNRVESQRKKSEIHISNERKKKKKKQPLTKKKKIDKEDGNASQQIKIVNKVCDVLNANV